MSNLDEGNADLFPLLKHLDALVDELRTHATAALEQFEENAVHKSRVTTRRLRAAVELLDRVLHSDHRKPFSKLTRKLRRRLGPLRDIDVMLAHLDEMNVDSEMAQAVAWLRDRLLADREKARRKSARKSPVSQILPKLSSWEQVRHDVAEARLAVPCLLAESIHSKLDEFINQANQLCAKQSGESPADLLAGHHDPHQLRIAGKSLRYTLELAEADGRELPDQLLKTFKKMQECLGDWHDFVVLAQRAMQGCLAEDLPLHDPAMQRQVLRLIDQAMTRSQQELERFAQLWSDRGQELAKIIRERFILTRPADLNQASPVSESQTDRDHAD